MDRNNLLAHVVASWGRTAQEMMAVEECSELIKALCKIPRGGSDEDVIDEIADVQIMIDQLKIIYGEPAVKAVEEKKLERLEKRLNKWLAKRTKPELLSSDFSFDEEIMFDGNKGEEMNGYVMATNKLIARLGLGEDFEVAPDFYALYDPKNMTIAMITIVDSVPEDVSLTHEEKSNLISAFQSYCQAELGLTLTEAWDKYGEETEEDNNVN